MILVIFVISGEFFHGLIFAVPPQKSAKIRFFGGKFFSSLYLTAHQFIASSDQRFAQKVILNFEDAISGLFLRRNQAFWPYLDHFGRILALAPPKSAKIF